jgi:hypothetical protein
MREVEHEGNGTLGRPGRRWENNIKMDMKDIICHRYELD